MIKVNLAKQAQKFLQKLPQKQTKQIARKIVGLQLNPLHQDSKKLHNYNYYRVDVGEYRIVYYWDDACVFIVVIGKRNDGEVYRKLAHA